MLGSPSRWLQRRGLLPFPLFLREFQIQVVPWRKHIQECPAVAVLDLHHFVHHEDLVEAKQQHNQGSGETLIQETWQCCHEQGRVSANAGR